MEEHLRPDLIVVRWRLPLLAGGWRALSIIPGRGCRRAETPGLEPPTLQVSGGAMMAVFEWSESWADPRRGISALGYRSPIDNERAYRRTAAMIRKLELLTPSVPDRSS